MRSGTLFGASWLTTDREGGVSQEAFASNNLAEHVGDDPAAVRDNRAALAGRLGVAEITFVRASHSNRVARVDGPGQDVAGADALVTDRDNVALAALGADCVMLGLAGADGWTAVVHCGWRGLVEQVVPSTLQYLSDQGSDPGGLQAHLGPSICPDCYPVDAGRAAQVAAVAPTAVVQDGDRWAIDVRAGVLAQLAAAGVGATWDARCTAEDPELYSYRRDHVTGRQALCVVRSDGA